MFSSVNKIVLEVFNVEKLDFSKTTVMCGSDISCSKSSTVQHSSKVQIAFGNPMGYLTFEQKNCKINFSLLQKFIKPTKNSSQAIFTRITHRLIEEAKFTYLFFWEGIWKTKKNNWRAGGETNWSLAVFGFETLSDRMCQPQIKLIEDLLPRDQLNQEAINELQKLIKIEQKISREDLVYKTVDSKKEMIYDFQIFGTIQSLGVGILNGAITLDHAVNKQLL